MTLGSVRIGSRPFTKRVLSGKARRGLVAICAALLVAAVVPSVSSPARATGAVLPDFGPGTRWVSYGHPLPQPDAVTLADMTLLKEYGATGIVTYTSVPGYDDAATIASALGLKVILGIDQPNDGAEDLAVVALAKALPSTVQGIVVGNEGLCWGKYSYGNLVNEIGWLHQELGDSLAIGTSEPLQVFQATYFGSTRYENNCFPGIFPGLLSLGDFLSVNLQAPGCNAAGSAQWVGDQLSWLRSITGKAVFAHEAYQMSDWGPAAGLQNTHWCSQTDQRDFFCALRSRTNSFSHFTGFDGPGGYPVQFGGLFTAERTPKLAALALQAC